MTYGMRCHVCLFISDISTIFYIKPKICPICGSGSITIWNSFGVITLEC